MAWPFRCVPTEATDDMTQAAEVDAIAVRSLREERRGEEMRGDEKELGEVNPPEVELRQEHQAAMSSNAKRAMTIAMSERASES